MQYKIPTEALRTQRGDRPSAGAQTTTTNTNYYY